MNFLKIAMFSVALTLLSPSVNAHETTAGDITIIHSWVRIMPAAAKVGAGYLTISNDGDEADQLISVSSPAAGLVEIHEMSMDNGVMRMRPLNDGIAIPAGDTVELAPGGFHLMFKKVTMPFVEGMTVPVTLTFKNAGSVEVEFRSGANAQDNAGEKPMKMDMNHDESSSDMNHSNMNHEQEGQSQ